MTIVCQTHRAKCCANMRHRYELAEPKLNACHHYILEVSKKLLSNKKVMVLLKKAFQKNKHESIATEMTNLTRRGLFLQKAAKRLVNRVLHVCKHYAGSLLKAIRLTTKLLIIEKGDFGEGLVSPSFMNLSTSLLIGRITLVLMSVADVGQ